MPLLNVRNLTVEFATTAGEFRFLGVDVATDRCRKCRISVLGRLGTEVLGGEGGQETEQEDQAQDTGCSPGPRPPALHSTGDCSSMLPTAPSRSRTTRRARSTLGTISRPQTASRQASRRIPR